MNKRIHFRNIRLFNNAGIVMPECKSNDKLLNCNINWTITSNKKEVTCKNCLKRMKGKWYMV